MSTATLEQRVREPESAVGAMPAEADLLILDDVVGFEDADSREHQACLPDPYPTATTRWGCEL